MPTLVVQRGHVPRTSGATGAPGEQNLARGVSALVADQVAAMAATVGWSTRIIDADEHSDRYRGDAFVAIHGDGSVHSSARGFSVGYRSSAGRVFAQAWKARYVQSGCPFPVRDDNYTTALARYYGTGRAVSVGNDRAIIVELGFLSNPTERKWLDSATGRRAAARAIVWATTGRDPLSQPTPTTPAPAEPDDLEAFLMSLPEAEQTFLRRLAEQGVRDGVDGQSMARQWLLDHRARVRAGVTEATYAAMSGFADRLADFGSNGRGAAVAVLALWREAGARGWRRSIEAVRENRDYTADELGVTRCDD